MVFMCGQLPCKATYIANCHCLTLNDARWRYLTLIDAISFHNRLHEFTPNVLFSHVLFLAHPSKQAIADELEPADAGPGLRSWWSALQVHMTSSSPPPDIDVSQALIELGILSCFFKCFINSMLFSLPMFSLSFIISFIISSSFFFPSFVLSFHFFCSSSVHSFCFLFSRSLAFPLFLF